MTATFIEPDTRTTDNNGDEDDWVHMTCHCSGFDRADCGLNLEGRPFRYNVPDEDNCPLCRAINDIGMRACGCACRNCEPVT